MPPSTRLSTSPVSSMYTSYVVTLVSVLPSGAIFCTTPVSVISGSASTDSVAFWPASTIGMSSSSISRISCMPAPLSTRVISFVPAETLSPFSTSTETTLPSHGATMASCSCFSIAFSSSTLVFVYSCSTRSLS